jgi:hypothetical protein
MIKLRVNLYAPDGWTVHPSHILAMENVMLLCSFHILIKCIYTNIKSNLVVPMLHITSNGLNAYSHPLVSKEKETFHLSSRSRGSTLYVGNFIYI